MAKPIQRGHTLLGLAWATALPAFLLAQPPADREHHQDFRGKRDLLPFVKTFGVNLDVISKKEDGGFRFTLTPTQEWLGPVGVAATIPLTGDFEITGTYEILAIERPPPGGAGVGVALNLANRPDFENLAKLGRFMLPKKGNVYIAEAWHKDLPKGHGLGMNKTHETEIKAGRLRLVREGRLMRYLVADGLDSEFRELEKREFNATDFNVVRFLVTNNGSPSLIDARLIDLRIRATGKTPLAPPPAPDHVDEAHQAPSRGGWIIVLVLVGAGAALAFFGGIAAWLLLRRGGPKRAKER